MNRFQRLWLISALSIGALSACAPLDGDFESELDELDEGEFEDVESSELQYAGRARLQNSMQGHCAYRVAKSSSVRVQACTGGAEEQWDVFRMSDGYYMLCEPGTDTTFSRTDVYGGVCVPPSWREQPFKPGNVYSATCHGQVTLTTTGTQANCLMRSGNNTHMSWITASTRTDYTRYGGRVETWEQPGFWNYSSPHIRWMRDGSQRRLTVDGTGVGLYNENNVPASQSWSLIP